MPHNQRISRLATAIPTLALAFVTTCIHADSFTQTNLVSDVPNLAALDPSVAQGSLHGRNRAFKVSSRGVVGISRHAKAGKLGVYLRAARARLVQWLQH